MRIFLWQHAGKFWWLDENHVGFSRPGQTRPTEAYGPYTEKVDAFDALPWGEDLDIVMGEPPCVSYPLPDEEEL